MFKLKKSLQRYLIKRIGMCVRVLVGISIVSFLLIHLAPGDPARLLLSPDATEEELDLFRKTMGLNDPLHIQYFNFMKGVMKGDLGTSLYYKTPNLELILSRLPATALLALAATIVAILIALPLGIIAGVRQGTFVDFFAMTFAILGQSISVIWLAYLLIWLFSVKLDVLPSFGYGNLKSLILPAFSLGIINAALITRLARAGMIDTLCEDYMLAIRAKGIENKKVIGRYALKNTLIPLVTVIGLQFATYLGGVIIVESIFSWPGIGKLSVNAIYGRDFPLVQATVLVVSSFFVIFILLILIRRTTQIRKKYLFKI